MNLRPAILSAPFPWLIIIIAKLFGKKTNIKSPQGKKNKEKNFFKLPRTLTFTYEGKRYIAILFLIGFAAINTGNNLLYLIVAMLLSIIIISGIMSESSLRKIEIERLPSENIYKDKPVKINYKITNIKKKIPSYSLVIKEAPQEELSGTGSYLIKIDNLTSENISSEYTFSKRGFIDLEAIAMSTRFPFGLFSKTRNIDIPTTLLVYPTTLPITTKLSYSGSSSGVTESIKKGFGGDLYGVREHQISDDSRHIDWKSSAKSGLLMHKEFTRDSDREITINFSNYSKEVDSPEETNEDFENSVSKTASLAKHYLELGFSVGLKTLNLNLAPQTGEKQKYLILKELALITPVQSKQTNATVTIEGN